MLAGQLVAPDRVEVVDAPDPVPAAGEVLVRSRWASICGSDLHLVHGYYRGPLPAPPGYPGHEGVGVVIESRAPGFRPGDRVLTVPPPLQARCFAEQHAVSAGSVIHLPEHAEPGELLLAQQLGAVVFAFRRFWPGLDVAGRTAAICGAGSAGLFFAQLALRAGFEHVLVADRAPDRLRCAERLGIPHVVDIRRESFVDAVRRVTHEVGADLAVEAVGLDETRIQCLEAVRPAGRIGYFGFPEEPGGASAWSFSEAWRKKPTIDVVNGAQAEPGLRSFREAIDLIATRRIDVQPLLRPVFGLADLAEAFGAARDRVGGKVRIDFGPVV